MLIFIVWSCQPFTQWNAPQITRQPPLANDHECLFNIFTTTLHILKAICSVPPPPVDVPHHDDEDPHNTAHFNTTTSVRFYTTSFKEKREVVKYSHNILQINTSISNTKLTTNNIGHTFICTVCTHSWRTQALGKLCILIQRTPCGQFHCAIIHAHTVTSCMTDTVLL